MSKLASTSLALAFALIGVASGSWNETWSDNFDGAAGSSPSGKWAFDIGGSGWGNKELEYYTDSTENAALSGDGHLNIVARTSVDDQHKCWYGPCKYTSARLKTQGLFTQTYGRFEASIKVPAGKGLWPAFWMLGEDITTVSWPACGEIDIMEIRGSQVHDALGTIHGPGYSGDKGVTATYTLPDGGDFNNNFHQFAVEWSPNKITWFVDGKAYVTRTPSDLPAGTKWVFDHPFFIILNFAVGGLFDGNPEGVTFPQTLSIDYVRVYEWVD